MLLIRLALRGGTLVCFARFCDTFRDVLARGQRAAEEPKERTGLAFVVSHPCLRNKGTARMGHPAGLMYGLKPIPSKELSFSVLILLDLCTA